MKLTLTRVFLDDNQTLGELELPDGSKYGTLELPWLKNQKTISSIPDGNYEVVKRFSPRFQNHFHVLNVPNRTYILIHHGNYYKNTKGCILVGKGHRDINKDGLLDVIDSKKAMDELNNKLPNKFTLDVKTRA
jgi:hypothetical protein